MKRLRSPLVLAVLLALAIVAPLIACAGRLGQVPASGGSAPTNHGPSDDTGDLALLPGVADPPDAAVVCDHDTRFKRTIGTLQGDHKRRIEQLAELMDYSVEWRRPNVAVLWKRFHDRRERPQFVLPELVTMVRTILGSMPAGGRPGDSDWQSRIRALASACSPDQVAALKAGRRLAIADLSPAQRSLLQGAIAARVIGRPRAAWQRLADDLGAIKKAYLSVEEVGPGAPVPPDVGQAWLCVPTAGGELDRVGLGRWTAGSYVPDPPLPPAGVFQPLPETERQAAQNVPDPLDQAVFVPSGKTTVRWLLKQVCERSNPPIRLGASPEIEPHVLIVAVTGLRVRTFMDCLAALGDWEWVKRADGSYLLRLSRESAAPRAGTGEAARKQEDAGAQWPFPRDLQIYLKLRDEKGRPIRARSFGIESQAQSGMTGATKDLGDFCLHKLKKGERKGFEELPPEQCEDILGLLTLRAIGTSAGDPVADTWLSARPGSLPVEVYLEGEVLMVSFLRPDGGRSEFGQNVMRDESGHLLNAGP